MATLESSRKNVEMAMTDRKQRQMKLVRDRYWKQFEKMTQLAEGSLDLHIKSRFCRSVWAPIDGR